MGATLPDGYPSDRFVIDPEGDAHLNGGSFFNDAGDDISDSLEVLNSLAPSELQYLDGLTAGTVSASKAVVVDSSKDIAGFNDISAAGTVIAPATLLTNDGTGTGAVAARIGATATEGLEIRVYETTLTPTAVETNALNVPAGAAILSVQTNVETALVAGGTSVTMSIGTAGDPDKYGTHGSDSLAKNQKIDTIPDWAVLGASEQILITAAATGGAADGDTVFSAGAVRVRIVYAALNSLDDAA